MATLIFYALILQLAISLLFYRRLRRTDKLYFVQFIPLAIAGAQAAVQLSRARKQKEAAKRAMNFRNSALDEATASTRREANTTRYLGQDVDEQNVRQGVADAYSNVAKASRSSADVLNAGARLQGAQQRAYQGISQQANSFRQNAMDKYRQMLVRQAGVIDENRQYSETLKGTAAQNQYNALNSFLGGVAATNWGSMGSTGSGWNYNPTTSNMGNGQMSGWGFNPNKFSSYRWNPNAFSANGSVR